jgi:hypothetical protein
MEKQPKTEAAKPAEPVDLFRRLLLIPVGGTGILQAMDYFGKLL